MNKAMLYIRENEQGSHVAMVHVHEVQESKETMSAFKRNVVLLNAMYPKYTIDMIGVLAQGLLLLLCCNCRGGVCLWLEEARALLLAWECMSQSVSFVLMFLWLFCVCVFAPRWRASSGPL